MWGLSTYVDVCCDHTVLTLDMEESHSPSHSFFSIILGAVLACTAVLQSERGRANATSPGMCLAVWKVGLVCKNKTVTAGRG